MYINSNPNKKKKKTFRFALISLPMCNFGSIFPTFLDLILIEFLEIKLYFIKK